MQKVHCLEIGVMCGQTKGKHMTTKTITAECSSCESSYDVIYMQELVSEELPEFCPFCGETIDSLSEEEYIEDDELDDNEKWD